MNLNIPGRILFQTGTVCLLGYGTPLVAVGYGLSVAAIKVAAEKVFPKICSSTTSKANIETAANLAALAITPLIFNAYRLTSLTFPQVLLMELAIVLSVLVLAQIFDIGIQRSHSHA